MAIVGGETAVLPDVIAGDSQNAFDLAGMVMGVVKGKPVLGSSIKPGDVILGAESSGLHSNGYTLARKVLLSKYSVDDNTDHLVQTVGEELLIPTRIYVRPVMEILKKKIRVCGLANITGGSFTKLARLNTKVRYDLDDLPASTGRYRSMARLTQRKCTARLTWVSAFALLHQRQVLMTSLVFLQSTRCTAKLSAG